MFSPQIIGWRETAALPALGIKHIKAKMDSGARTSVLHAVNVRYDSLLAQVSFTVPPHRNKINVPDSGVHCQATVVDRRLFRSTSGHSEWRYIITTTLCIGAECWRIDLSLAARETMLFPLLLGRKALQRRYLIDVGRSYLLSQQS